MCSTCSNYISKPKYPLSLIGIYLIFTLISWHCSRTSMILVFWWHNKTLLFHVKTWIFLWFLSIKNIFLPVVPWVHAWKFVFSPKCFKFLLFEKCDITRLLLCHFSQYEPFKAMFVIENGSSQCSKY